MPTQDPSSLIHFLQSVYPSGNAIAKKIAGYFQPAEFRKRTLFVEEGHRSQEYLFLEAGIMRSFLFDTQGMEVTTNFYSPGNVVFEAASFSSRSPRRNPFKP